MADISKITNGGTTYDVKDAVTRDAVTNAVTNHGIGTVYTETILAPVTIAPGDWDEETLGVILPNVFLEFIPGDTYIFTINGTENVVGITDFGNGAIGIQSEDTYFAVITNLPGVVGTVIGCADYPLPSESMTFSVAHVIINKIDSKFIDPWDFVLFIDNAAHTAPVVIKGAQEAIVEQLKGPDPMIKAFVFARHPGFETGHYIYSQGLPMLNLLASDTPDTYDSVVVVPCTPTPNMSLDDTAWCWFPDGTWEIL